MPVNAAVYVNFDDVEFAIKKLARQLNKEHTMEAYLSHRYALSRGQRRRKKRLKARARIVNALQKTQKAYEENGRVEL